MVCICNPLTDSANPANKAVRALGKRNCNTMVEYSGYSELPEKNVFNTSLTGIFTDPRKISAIKRMTSKINKLTQIMIFLYPDINLLCCVKK